MIVEVETKQGNEPMTLMTAPVATLTDFERGQRDYISGRRMCPFQIIERQEMWKDGWLTQKGGRGA